MQEWDETIQRLNGYKIDLSGCKIVIEHKGGQRNNEFKTEV